MRTYTEREAAKRAEVSLSTLRKAIKSGEIGFRRGKITAPQLSAWAKRKNGNGSEEPAEYRPAVADHFNADTHEPRTIIVSESDFQRLAEIGLRSILDTSN